LFPACAFSVLGNMSATIAQLAEVNATVALLKTQMAAIDPNGQLVNELNAWFYAYCGCLVFFMQAGFALLEAGSVRAKNAKNILMKNLLDACIGALIWWGWGYGVAYQGAGDPDNGFIGHNVKGDTSLGHFFVGGYDAVSTTYTGDVIPGDGYDYGAWWFQYVFAAAAATIVSGAMAERTSLVGYLVYTIFITGFIYPVVVYWTWGYGWAFRWNGGLQDFAGSGIVHMTGGIAALCGAAIVGPRKGRFDESKKPIAMPAHNTTFQVLGTFILWLGWYGFNPGSTLAIVGQGEVMARAICTTTLSAASGGITVVLLDKMLASKTWDVGMLCNGILAGLVSITAGAADVLPWMAMVIGFLGGFVYIASSKITLYVCKVDDPLDAFSVHGCCGFWGVMANALFAADLPGRGVKGAFYGNGAPLGAGLVFCFADIGWTGGLSCIMFMSLKMANVLRVSAEVEDAGMDVSKHGGSAYEQPK